MTSSQDRVEWVVRCITDTCIANEKYFGDLDSVVGDGDFGFSLARGFERVDEGWDTFDRSDIGTFLMKIAVVITSRVGGTSGPIWGTAFLRAGSAVKGKVDLVGDDVVAMLRAAIAGIMARGGASLGEKTLLDSLVPMTDAIEERLAAGDSTADILTAAATTARTTADATKELEAKRGRASYTGERSIGSVDPGAIAIAVLMEKIAETWFE